MPNFLLIHLLSLTIDYGLSQLDPHSNLPEVIAHVVNHFSYQEEPSIFDCWFLNTEQEIIGSIVSFPKITHIPKVLASISTLSSPSIRKPSMLVLSADACKDGNLALALFKSSVVEHDTKIIALVDFYDIDHLVTLYDSLFGGIVWNIVFVHVQFNLFLYYNPFKGSFVYWKDMGIERMFIDHTSNLYGTRVRFTLVGSSPWCTLPMNGHSRGSICKWITETLRHKNGSWHGILLYCNPGTMDCMKQMSHDSNGTSYDLVLNTCSMRSLLPATLELTEPVRLIILTPRGRILKMFELFTYPFNGDLWTLILALMIGCAIASTLFPNLFENDPFLLSICGFERYSLHRARSHEKLILLSLVILFFFISSAYENKFISLMTRYPRVRDPITLDDLRQAGIKVATGRDDQLALECRFPDPELRSLIEVQNTISVYWPKTMAVMTEARMARVILYSSHCIDPGTGDVNFIPLKGYSIDMRINSVNIEPKSRFRTMFRETERRFFDAGLMKHWFEELLYETMEYRRANDLSKVDMIAGKVINVSELKPVWMLMLCGWVVAAGVLFIEIIWRKLEQKFVRADKLFYRRAVPCQVSKKM